MIKNLKKLLKVAEPFQSRRKILLQILNNVFDEIDAEKLTRKELSKHKFKGAVYVLGAGKAAYKMAKAVHGVLDIKDGLIIVPKGTKVPKIPGIKIGFASHPIPCSEGRKSAEKLLHFAEKLKENDQVIFLLSGGGSAMLPLPIQGVSLNDKIKITKKLIGSGATINEINTVRKHISQIKGGNLAKALFPAKTLCLALSDVVGDDPSVIASGPLSPDPTTVKDARKILKKYNLKIKLTETADTKDPCFKNIDYKIIAGHKAVHEAACAIAKKMRIRVHKQSDSVTGEARVVGPQLVRKAQKGLLVATGETTVNVTGNGAGGRNQELVLSALQHLKHNQTILSIGTDGVDGITPKKIAGAIADQSIPTENAQKFLDQNDSYNFFLRKNALIETGQLSQNLGDLILILTT